MTDLRPLVHIMRRPGEALCGMALVTTGRLVFKDGKLVDGLDLCVMCACVRDARDAYHRLYRQPRGNGPTPL